MSADTFEFDDRNHAERFVGTLHDPAATPGDVLTVQADKSIAAKPGGGSMPIQTIQFAFDTPGLAVQAFAVTAVDQGAQKFTIAGDHSALFPATAAFVVSGSTGNDSTYSVASVAVVAGHTVVTTNEAIPDATADGSLNNSGTAGIVVSTASGYVMDLLNTTVAFDGPGAPTLALYELDITNPNGVLLSYHDEINSVGISLGEQASFANMKQVTAPIVAALVNDSLTNPGNTQGEATMQLWTFS